MLSALLVVAARHADPKTVFDLKKRRLHRAGQAPILGTLQMFAYGLHRTTKLATSNTAIFGTVKKDPYTAEQKALLLSTWGAMFSYFTSIEQIRERYWDFVTLSPTDPRHAWGFLVTHAALTIMLADGLTFSDLTQGNPQLETLLDEPSSQFGVPQGSYATFKEHAIHVATSTQLMTGEAWGPIAKKDLVSQKALDDKRVQWAEDEIAADTAIAKEKLGKHGVKLFLKNAIDIAKDSTKQAIFPAQKTFAEWAGDTRVARDGKPFMGATQWRSDRSEASAWRRRRRSLPELVPLEHRPARLLASRSSVRGHLGRAEGVIRRRRRGEEMGRRTAREGQLVQRSAQQALPREVEAVFVTARLPGALAHSRDRIDQRGRQLLPPSSTRSPSTPSERCGRGSRSSRRRARSSTR